MHALIVVSHPNPSSLTHALTERIGAGISASNPSDSFEIADLWAERFDPRFSPGDIATHLRQAPPPDDVVEEQKRIDRSDALVLVYPIFWWSMPGLLKGWIDRVFTNGWAYDETPDGHLTKKLQWLNAHLVAIGGADQRTYARHGYFGAMRLQIDHGIFDYCGARVLTSELLIPSSRTAATGHLEAVEQVGRRVFSDRR